MKKKTMKILEKKKETLSAFLRTSYREKGQGSELEMVRRKMVREDSQRERGTLDMIFLRR